MTATRPRPTIGLLARRGLGLVPLALLLWLGATLFLDRPGLRAEYFALVSPWEGKPLFTTISAPRIDGATLERERLLTDVLFSVRWSGWWQVTEKGRHRFRIDADDGAYLRIGDEVVVDSHGLFRQRRTGGTVDLEPGLHRFELGFFQTRGDHGLRLDWFPPNTGREAASPLAADRLHTRRPGVRPLLRSLLGSWPVVYRRLLGVVLLLAGLALATRSGALARTIYDRLGPAERLARVDDPRLRSALLLALFTATFFATLPLTGPLRGGDDTAYLEAAYLGEESWFFRRYAHVYLLRGFLFLCGGDPLLAARIWWSFVFATTVAALAVAARSIGRGLQLGTLAAALFLLLSQLSIMSNIGAAFADYSAMMFVTAAVAVYLHGPGAARDRSPPLREWHALAIGALTVAAFRSKEVGAILVLLVPLLAIAKGRFEPRLFARRLVFWSTGAGAALLILALLDGWILGNFMLFFDGERASRLNPMNFPSGVAQRPDNQSWFHAIWNGSGHPANRSLRYLWLGVLAAAVAAGVRRRRLELRLLHLLPIAYLMTLIVLYVQMPHPVSPRMLIPIAPVACFLTALSLHYAGLDEIPWRRLLAPRWSIPAALAAAILALVVIPYRLGTLAAADFLPTDLLAPFGWTPELFALGVLLPTAILAGLGALTFVAHQRPARLLALGVLFLALFGPGFTYNQHDLGRRVGVQTSNLLLYPWRAFRSELEADPPRVVALSPQVVWRYRMSTATRGSLARLALRRSEVYVTLSPDPPHEADAAIATREGYRTWLREDPSLAERAVRGPLGLLVLTRPQAAPEAPGDRRARPRPDAPPD